MATEFTIPANVLTDLTYGFVEREAQIAVIDGALPGDFIHVGDSVGRVVDYLWQVDQQRCLTAIWTYTLEIQKLTNPKVKLDDVLRALRFATTMPTDQFLEMTTQARAGAPQWAGRPI